MRCPLIVYPKVNHRQLAADPDELRNLAADPAHGQTLARLESLLEGWRAAMADAAPLATSDPPPLRRDLTGRERRPDRWQPQWIVDKYFDPPDLFAIRSPPVGERQGVLSNGWVCAFPEGYDDVRHVISYVEGIDSEERGSATQLYFVILEVVDCVPGTAEVVRRNIGLGIRVKPFQHSVDEIPEFCLEFLPFDSLIPLVEEFDPGVLRFVPSPRQLDPT